MVKRRPSLMGQVARTAGRTAVIAGTATAVSGKVAAKQAGNAPAQAAPAAAASAGLSADAMEQLKKLSELHKSGILTDAEFERQKALILG
jgi:hypothetical protein